MNSAVVLHMGKEQLLEKPLYYLCQSCSFPILISEKNHLSCERCGEKYFYPKPASIQASLAYSFTALIFFVPANLLPFMTIELYGRKNSSTIWEGIQSLADNGSWPIAMVVFLASLMIPLLKLVVLFYLAATAHHHQNEKFKTKLFHFIEAIGRWSMLDIFLLAVLVAIMKLGPWAQVQPEPGSLLFLLVVVFTMLASNAFDPRLLWSEENAVEHKKNF